jgi:hypothetical protein
MNFRRYVPSSCLDTRYGSRLDTVRFEEVGWMFDYPSTFGAIRVICRRDRRITITNIDSGRVERRTEV